MSNPMPAPSPMPSPAPNPSPSPTPTGSPTPTPTPGPTTASRFAFGIIDFEASGGFFGGSINSSTGQITPLAGNPFSNTLGQNIVIQVLADRAGRFLYSLNLGATAQGGVLGQPGINEYQIDHAKGTLDPVPNGDVIFTASGLNAQLAIDGNGKFLYQPDGRAIDLYSINQATGLLTAMGSMTGAVPVGSFSTASPDGRFLFNAGGGKVEAFAIDPASGQLTSTGAAVSTSGSGGPMTVTSDSQFLLVANSTEATLAVFRIGGGMLTPISGSPFSIDPQAEFLSLTPDNRFLYIAFGQPSQGNVKGYMLELSAGHVTNIPGATVTSGTSVNVDGSGRFAYISLNLQLVTYAIDPASGALTSTSQAAQPFTDDPTNMVLTP